MKYTPDFSSRFRILKGGKISLVVSALLAGSTMSFAAPAGGSVTSGSATINQNGSVTTINQSTNKASINWQDFSIGKSETVNFVQPSSQSVTLNRVVGASQSLIEGAMNANGQVFLLNPNGVLFANGSQINVGGLVASTLNITDANFQAGNYVFEGTSQNSVLNMGTITANNGYVALMGKHVANEGTIVATMGNVQLASGEKISLNLNGNSLVKLMIDQGTMDALVENKGLIKADGGQVYLTTQALNTILDGMVNNTGIIEAKTLNDVTGKVVLFAHGGTANISGTIDASGGFIETSGEKLKVTDGTTIKAKTWLLDPTNITIASGGSEALSGTPATTSTAGDVTISGATINASLNSGTSVLLDATNDITVNDNISKTGGTEATLTFKAGRDIVVANGTDITSTSNKLNTIFWSDSDGNNDGMIYLKNGSSINSYGGDITLSGGADLTTGFAIGNAQNANGVTLDNVDLLSSGGNILIRGKSRAGVATNITYSVGSFSNTDGVRLHGGNTINSGSGTIKIVGESVGTSGAGNGIELSHSVADYITSNSTLANSIYMEGQAGPSNLTDSWGIYTWIATIQSINGGGIYLKGDGEKNNGITVPTSSSILANSGKITLEGTGYGTGAKAVEVAGYIGQKTGTGVTSSSSDIEIIGNTFAVSGRIQSSGNLVLRPYTSGTTIGIGGATGTLALASNYFSTNFVNGFNNITIGSETAGTINIGGTTTYYDNLTFKTASDIFTNTSTTLSSNGANSLVFWADSDNTNAGGIKLNSGSSIITNGGDLWMGGSLQSGTLWNNLSVGSGYARGTGVATTGGIDISGTTLYTGGGDIKMYGYAPSAGGIGIKLTNSIISTQTNSNATTAGGSIDLRGDGYYTSSGNGHGLLVDGSSIVGGSGGIIIEGHASANNTGQWSAPFFFGSAQSTQAGYVYTLDDGAIHFNLYGTNVTNPQSYNNFMQEDYANTTIGKSGQNSNITITTYGNSNAGLHLPNIITGGNLTIDISNSPNLGSGTTAGWDTGSPWNTIDISAGDNSQLTIGGNTTIIGNVGSSASVRFTNINNDFGSIFSATNIKNLRVIDSDTFVLDAINTIGTIDIVTLIGNMTLNGSISTTNTTSSAITLNAGKSTVSGISTGGNIIHTNGTLTTGTGGRATLFSGSVIGSTGLTTLIGSGSGHFRYNSDETTTNYTAAMSSGNYVIYREQPTLSVTPMSASNTYGNSVSGLSGTLSGYINGDSSSTTTGTANFSTTATNTSNAGTYDITYNSGLVNSLGYAIIDALGSNGEYTINRVNLTVTVDNASKLYGDIDPVFTYQITSGSLVGADTLSGVLSRNLGEEVGTYLIDASGLLNPNYLITKHNGVFSILTRDTTPNFSENLISNLLKNIEPVHLNDVIVHNSEDQIIARLLESSIKNQLDTLPNELNEITQTFSPTSVSENLTHQTLENSPSSVNSFAIVSTPQGLPNNVQTSLDSIDQKSNLAVSKTIQTSNDKQTSSIQTKSASNDIVQNLSNDDITKSIQTVENAMQEKGFTTVESQMITNALLEVSLNNPANANNVANNVANAIALDKASKAASLSDGTFENTNSLFDTTFQNLLKKGVAPKDAYAQASLLIKVTLPKEISLADTFSSISKAEGEMLLNLMGKGYSQEEAYKQVKLIHFPKESQKTEIINGKITDEYKYIDKFLVHNSLEQAIELSKKISMLEKHYRQIDNNSINSFYADRNLKKPVSNSLEFEKILLHELKHSNFSDAYRNAISKIKTIPLNQVTPLEQMAQAKIAKKGTNGEKIWWVEFTKQILNGKNQNEAIQSANRIQKLCEARTKQSQIVENKYLKGVSK